ncbi:hypothetical protein B0H12DRAFT_225177 [Mycena haematopus]|nr:hypothetical protein B0H12DRAFT_225177 [Mycena haematopus]
MLMTPSLDKAQQIHLISNDTVGTYWTPIIHMDGAMESTPVLAHDIPKLSTLEDIHNEQSFNNMYVHESPIREGDYRVWIYGTIFATKAGGLLSYRVSIPNNTNHQWCQRTPSMESGSLFRYSISYHGHYVLYRRAQGYVISAAASLASPRPARVDMPSCGDHIDVGPYSGAVTYSTHSSIVIQYYK